MMAATDPIVPGPLSNGPDVLLILEPDMAATAHDAVAATNGQVKGPVGWRDAPDRLARQSLIGVVLAEARGADDAAVVHALPLLDAMARRGEAQIVVTFDVEQIDLVAANIADPAVTLLCNPTEAERFVALSLARGTGVAAVHDVGREAESARLRQLNDEVARIAETLARLTRGERARDLRGDPAVVADAGRSYRGPPLAVAGPEIAARDIREAIRARRLRDQFFGGGLFEDPAWDMLLDLLAAEIERAQVSVSSLCIAAAVAPTTALRWIARMTDAGLFERRPDPFDRRRAFMGLTDRASTGMRNYVAAVGNAGLRIA